MKGCLVQNGIATDSVTSNEIEWNKGIYLIFKTPVLWLRTRRLRNKFPRNVGELLTESSHCIHPITGRLGTKSLQWIDKCHSSLVMLGVLPAQQLHCKDKSLWKRAAKLHLDDLPLCCCKKHSLQSTLKSCFVQQLHRLLLHGVTNRCVQNCVDIGIET